MFRKGFTLVELLVVVAILALLMAILLPALAASRRTAKSAVCLTKLRQIAQASLLYAQDNRDLLPRSSHSALASGVMPWGYALFPYLGLGAYAGPGPAWDRLFNGLYRCPEDPRRDLWSYGKNAWFELTPGESGEIDKVPLGPTFPTTRSIPRPFATVFFAELGSGSMADHVMAHFWYLGGAPEVDAARHRSGSNYVFVDGHAESRRFPSTFLPPGIDLWHPGRAR